MTKNDRIAAWVAALGMTGIFAVALVPGRVLTGAVTIGVSLAMLGLYSWRSKG